VSRRRWWERGRRSIDAEVAWFEEAGLDFRLDDRLLEEKGVVTFGGDLRLGERRSPSSVMYPPAYDVGGHPTVIAPDLRLGRHQNPDGVLCLDHPVFGETHPMYGAEAVERAERLWDLWENDRDRLHREEADAPDPRSNYYPYAPESAVVLIDVDVSGSDAGFVHLAALQTEPLRAAVTTVRASHPEPKTIGGGPGIESFAGPIEINGVWSRLDEAPPVERQAFYDWAKANHRRLIDDQIKMARVFGQSQKRPDTPALIAFVYPDEGPRRGEIHDAWLFLVVHPDGAKAFLARGFHLQRGERWLRQPQLRPLESKRVAVLGVGALGSQVADLLAKAGVGTIFVIDADIFTPGNRVRHQLDLSELGRAKVHGVGGRLLRVDPWCKVEIQGAAFGQAAPATELVAQTQEVDDKLVEELGGCDLLVNATAHSVTSSYISSVAAEIDTPVVHAWVGAGAWGGRILRQVPGASGCWNCLALAQKQPAGAEVPPVPHDPAVEEVMERGCADPTFTGPGFELTTAAAAAARLCVQQLLAKDGGYPPPTYDLATLSFRTETIAEPDVRYTRLPAHPDCTTCQPPAYGD
jgi:molybdopterin/thiamine biosynthesis adenylyltransferase